MNNKLHVSVTSDAQTSTILLYTFVNHFELLLFFFFMYWGHYNFFSLPFLVKGKGFPSIWLVDWFVCLFVCPSLFAPDFCITEMYITA